jgi:hypothetical protein
MVSDAMEFDSVILGLGQRTREALQTIIGRLGNQPFTWEIVERIKPTTMTGAEWKAALVRLRQAKLLRTYRKAWGERLFMLPAEHYTQLHSLCTPPLEVPPIACEDQQVARDTLSAFRPSLAFELLRFLSAIDREPLMLKKDGIVHKRSIQKAMQKVQLQDLELSGLEWTYAYQDVYPPAFAVLLDFSLRLGFVHITEHSISVLRDEIESWLQDQSIQQIDSQLFQIWMSLCLPKTTVFQHVALGLNRLDREGWFETDKLTGWAALFAQEPRSAVELAAEAERRWLKPLAAFGWLELGNYAGNRVGRFVVREWDRLETEAENALASWEQSLFVQPDFELLVPIHQCSASLLWMLLHVAELQREDILCSFRLSKSSYMAARDRGYPVEGLPGELTSHAKYGVPDNVKSTMEGWQSQLGRIEIRNMLVLSCRDQAAADELSLLAAIQPFLARRLGERDFMVDRTRLSELRSRLEHAGYAPSLQCLGGESELELDKENSKQQLDGLIYPNSAHPLFAEDIEPVNLEDCFPELSNVPPIWFHQYRAYHSSTRKEMIRQAIEWQTALRLRKNGEDVLFAPTQLVEGRGEWTVCGVESAKQVTLHSDEWEEMQLILPGINANN